MVSPAVYTVEAVRAALRHDDEEVMAIILNYLALRAAEDSEDVLQAAGELLRDVYGFAAALALSLSHDIPQLAEQVLDVYAMGAMEEA